MNLYMRAVRMRPDWDEGWWALGTIAYDLDKYPDCLQAFQRLLVMKPKFAPAYILSGLCQFSLHEYEPSYQSLIRAERLGFEGSPELARVGRYHFALLLTKFGSFEKAISMYNFLTRTGGGSPEINAAAGIAGMRKQYLPSEVPASERALISTFGEALGAAFAQDPKVAVERFEAAIAAYPEVADLHYRFGAYLLNNDAERGMKEILKTLELDPNHVPALVTATLQSITFGDFNQARQYGERAVRAAPSGFASHLALGRALIGAKDLPGATKELERAVALAPESPESRFALANAYARAGRKADADRERAEFERLRKLIDSTVNDR